MQQTVLENQVKQIGNYLLEKKIGKGAFGKVFRARNTETNKIYAIKRINKSKLSKHDKLPGLLKTEIKIMQIISHPNILHCFEVIESERHYYLVLNFCEQGDIENYMKDKSINYFEEEKAIAFLKQIMNGFAELRKKQIMHRDFKLANIFLSNDVLIIGDFGLSRMGVDVTSTMLGTPMTKAPELFDSPNNSDNYTSKADIWSIGVVYYQLLFGVTPYTGMTENGLYQQIRKNTGANLKFPTTISDESKDVLRKMLTIDPQARINWVDLFNHPVFNKKSALKDSAHEEMLKLLIAYQQLVTESKADPNTEFEINQKESENTEFSIFNTSLKSLSEEDIDTKKAEPKLVVQNHQTTQMNELKDWEIYEKNKILFFLSTALQLQFESTQPEFSELKDAFLLISNLLLIKADILNNEFLEKINSKTTKFGFDQNVWLAFIITDAFIVLLNEFESISSMLKNDLKNIEKLIKRKKVLIRRNSLVLMNKSSDLGEIDKEIETEKKEIMIKMKINETYTKKVENLQILDALDKLIDVCVFPQQNLKPKIQTVSGLKNFDINKFYQKLTQPFEQRRNY